MYYSFNLDGQGEGRIPPPRPHFRCSYGLTVNLSKSVCLVHQQNRRTGALVTLPVHREFCIVIGFRPASSAENGKSEKIFTFFRRPAKGPPKSPGDPPASHSPIMKNQRQIVKSFILPFSRRSAFQNPAARPSRFILYDRPPSNVRHASLTIPFTPPPCCHLCPFLPHRRDTEDTEVLSCPTLCRKGKHLVLPARFLNGSAVTP
jgi:hypothetical protein